jgi:hypothetical protein
VKWTLSVEQFTAARFISAGGESGATCGDKSISGEEGAQRGSRSHLRQNHRAGATCGGIIEQEPPAARKTPAARKERDREQEPPAAEA